MKVYYLNNFRGFKETFLSFDRVNFLVGENSTGKTSIICLLALMHNYLFWYNLDFNVEDMSLGSFDDIRSKNTTSNYFTVGRFLSDRPGQHDKPSYFLGNVLKFKNENGLPVPCEYDLFWGQHVLLMRFEKSSIRFVHRQVMGVSASNDLMENAKKALKHVHNLRFRARDFRMLKNKNLGLPVMYYPFLALEDDKNLKKLDLNGRLIQPEFGGDLFSLVAPIRAKPKAIYASIRSSHTSEGDHTPFIFKSMCESGENKRAIESLNKFGKESGLFDSIEAKSFGKTKTSPFELDVVKNGKKYKIPSVGYGVSQIFPILIEILTKPNGTTFAIQQPEVHLHPRAQAAFGELLYHIALVDQKQFIIETHSDYLLDRYRYAIYTNKKKVPSQVLFFENENAFNRIASLRIEEDGKYPTSQPKGFREFFVNESIKLLEI